MNERIRELAKKAGGHFSTHNLMSNPVQHRESIELWDDKIEKFAELIVRECAKALDDKLSNPDGANMAYCDGSDLLEHFGVEE